MFLATLFIFSAFSATLNADLKLETPVKVISGESAVEAILKGENLEEDEFFDANLNIEQNTDYNLAYKNQQVTFSRKENFHKSGEILVFPGQSDPFPMFVCFRCRSLSFMFQRSWICSITIARSVDDDRDFCLMVDAREIAKIAKIFDIDENQVLAAIPHEYVRRSLELQTNPHLEFCVHDRAFSNFATAQQELEPLENHQILAKNSFGLDGRLTIDLEHFQQSPRCPQSIRDLRSTLRPEINLP